MCVRVATSYVIFQYVCLYSPVCSKIQYDIVHRWLCDEVALLSFIRNTGGRSSLLPYQWSRVGSSSLLTAPVLWFPSISLKYNMEKTLFFTDNLPIGVSVHPLFSSSSCTEYFALCMGIILLHIVTLFVIVKVYIYSYRHTKGVIVQLFPISTACSEFLALRMGVIILHTVTLFVIAKVYLYNYRHIIGYKHKLTKAYGKHTWCDWIDDAYPLLCDCIVYCPVCAYVQPLNRL